MKIVIAAVICMVGLTACPQPQNDAQATQKAKELETKVTATQKAAAVQAQAVKQLTGEAPPTVEAVKAEVNANVGDIQSQVDTKAIAISPTEPAPARSPEPIPPVKDTKASAVVPEKPPAKVVTPPVLPVIPKNAVPLIPDVIAAIDDIWPDMPMRSYFPAQIEQESCITLTHSKCWNPKAELKTSREYGFGLGQLTIAYTATGAVRFNSWEEVKAQNPGLKDWAWSDRYNPLMQIKAIVVKNRVNWGSIKWDTADLDNKMAFLATYYNGGSPLKDRNLCVNTKGCDPSKWWGNVELYSIKSKTKLSEYGGKSLFQISREYPVKVLRERRPKYIPYVGT